MVEYELTDLVPVQDAMLNISRYGFANKPVGTHISRTMMLADLRQLLAACPANASPKQYYTAVVVDNVLLKPTVTTRRQSLRRLKELYCLDERVLLFRALLDMWSQDEAAQPLIAVQCALATDPLLRATAELVLALAPGETVTPHMFEATVAKAFPDRYSITSLASIGRNVASSWQQSGHLSGKLHKVRARVQARPTATAYALLLGYTCGARGEALFQTLWCELLDTPIHELHTHATVAAQQGWLEYRRAGDVTELSFHHLLRDSLIEDSSGKQL